MGERTVALSYHINLNHLSLGPAEREVYLHETLPELLASIEVPSTISACAEDLLIIRNDSPDAWKTLQDSPHLKLAPSLFSHALAELFPETFVRQAGLARTIGSALLPPDKWLPFGFPPELSVPPPSVQQELSQIWPGTVYCQSRASGQFGRRLPAYFVNHQGGLAFASSSRTLAYREAIHAYLRDAVETDQVIDALHEDTACLDDGVPVIARIDLETPVFNAVRFGMNETGPARTDLFTKLQGVYARAYNTRFVFIDEHILETAQTVEAGPPHMALAATDKWRDRSLRDHVRAHEQSSGYLQLLYWSAMHSDYFTGTSRESPIVLRVGRDGQEGWAVIRQRDIARRSELAPKICALAMSKPLGDIVDSKNDPHLYRTHRALQTAYDLLMRA